MNLETLFSVASLMAMAGWLILLASPWMPIWSNRIGGFVIPALLSVGYLLLLLLSQGSEDGGFGSLAGVVALFGQPQAVLAGWVHFLAFDLFIGAWQCRVARADGIAFVWVIPCLALTFLLGPLGLLAFLGLRVVLAKQGPIAA